MKMKTLVRLYAILFEAFLPVLLYVVHSDFGFGAPMQVKEHNCLESAHPDGCLEKVKRAWEARYGLLD
jgi:hypothetical protein